MNNEILINQFLVHQLDILKSPNVHMKNESAVFKKINEIISQGADQLQVIQFLGVLPSNI